MDKSMEAAALAIYGESDWGSLPEEIRANYRKAACLAIAAYRDSEIADLRAKLEAAEQNEARYLYWREHHGWSGYFDDGASNSEDPGDIDAAIDAARGGERG